jgi:hypothetical protein
VSHYCAACRQQVIACSHTPEEITGGKPQPILKTQYKFIHFEQAQFASETWQCVNNRKKSILGTIEYDYGWKQWVYCPNENTIYSSGCLTDVIDFLDQLAKSS